MSRSANPPSTAAPPGPEPTYFWEDFPVGQVREFGGKRMEADEIVSFASAYDPQPFHLSEEGGKASLFGALCASGWHTCAVTMRMMCDHYLLDSASLGSPGLESLKWLKPVFPGDVLPVALKKGEVQAFCQGDPLGWMARERDGLIEVANNLTGDYAHRTCCVLGIRGGLIRQERPVATALALAVDARKAPGGAA